jgi:hypothetical protein
MAGLTDTLRAVQQDAANVDVSTLDAIGVRRLLDEVARSDRALSALKIRLGQRCNMLSAQGRSPDADEVFIGIGRESSATAHRDARRAGIVDEIPQLGTAIDSGRIGGEHLDAIARVAGRLDPELRPGFDNAAVDLVASSPELPVDTFARAVRRLADRAAEDHGRSRAIEQRAASELSTWTDRNGMGHLRATLDPERFASVVNAISRQSKALAASAKAAGEPVVLGRALDADALVELVQHGNGRSGRPEITVVVDADTLTRGPHEHSVRETLDGAELAFDTVARLCCDAVVRAVRLDEEGVPIDVGRRHRTATRAQWAALGSIHDSCAWSGCDRPLSWCQAHHVREWENGGPTDLDNLVPLCTKHHHAVHEGQWTVKLVPDRTLRIFCPDGTHHADARPGRLETVGISRQGALRRRSDN